MSDTDQRPPPPGKAESLFAAWAARVEAGEKIEFRSVLRRHPECARELEQLHDDWLQFAPLLNRVVPGLVASESGVLVPPLASAKDDDAPPSSDELFARLGLHGPGESRYRFRAVIGRGGGGVVLRVWDSKLNRALAMKVVLGREEERLSGDTPRVDGRTLSRFVDEARIAAQLNHPGIVPVHELGADEAGRAFFTMKLVKGEDLARIFERVFTGEGDWNQPRALGYLLRVCEAMAYAHDKGVVHRDLKPANVMVGPYGEVHVMDWGLARVLGEKDTRDLRIRPQPAAPISAVDSFRAGERKASPESPLVTMDGSVIGTPAYMSPEQARGELEDVGPRSDVYAVGAMLYHLLTGEPPFSPRGANVPPHVVLLNVMHGPPKPVEELSPRAAPELVAICEKAMQRQSTHRYGSMLELATDLRAFLEGRVVEAYETGTWAETKKWVQRNRALAGSLLATGLAVAALIVALVRAASQQAELATIDRRARTEAEQSAERERQATTIAKANEERAKQAELEARAAEARADEAARAAEENAYVAAVVGAQAALRANEPANLRRLLDSAPERLRNWEWRHLNAISDTSLLALEGHSPRWSPDGKWIVTASDSKASVWDVASGRELVKLAGHAGDVTSANFSPDGTRVVTASEDGSARVWNAASGVELARLEGHNQALTSASFSPDGTRVVTASKDCFACVWDAASGCPLVRLEGHRDDILRASFSPDGTRLVTESEWGDTRVWDSASGQELVELVWPEYGESKRSPDWTRVVTAHDEGFARVQDATSGKELATLVVHTAEFEVTSFSPDGARVITASDDGAARVWDLASGRELAKLEGDFDHNNTTAGFSPDGARVVSASGYFARVWDAANGRLLAKLEGHTAAISSASFSPDGSRIVTESYDGSVRVWDAASCGALATKFASRVGEADFVSDGTQVFTMSDDGEGRLWDVATGLELVATAAHTSRPTSHSFSMDGTRVVTVHEDNSAHVWDAASGRLLTKLLGHTDDIQTAQFSPDGNRVLTVSDDDSVRVWNAASGVELAKLVVPGYWDLDESLSPDGTRFIQVSDVGTARVMDAANGRCLATLEGHTDEISSADFSADGTRVATVSDEIVCVWDATSGRLLAKLDQRNLDSTYDSESLSADGTRVVTVSEGSARICDTTSGRVLMTLEDDTRYFGSASFCGDGRRVLTVQHSGYGHDSPCLWDATTGRLLAKLDGHAASINSVVFSADGARVLTASDDSVRVWDAGSGLELAKLMEHTEGVDSARLSPDGTRVVTVSDGFIRIWNAANGSLLAELRCQTDESVRFSSDATRLLTTSSWDDGAHVWDATNGRLLARVDFTNEFCSILSFSPDRNRISAVFDYTVCVYDALSGRLLSRVPRSSSRSLSAGFTLDGTPVVELVEDLSTHVLDLASGKELAKPKEADAIDGASFRLRGLRAHEVVTSVTTSHYPGIPIDTYPETTLDSEVDEFTVKDDTTGRQTAKLEVALHRPESVRFTSDGTRLITVSSKDGLTQVWDPTSGRELARLTGHYGPITRASFSQDGTRVVAVSADGSVEIWDSVPYRVRYAERKALEAARPAGERSLAEALAQSQDVVAAAARLRADSSLDPLVRRAALNRLAERCATAREHTRVLDSARAERERIRQMVAVLRPSGEERKAPTALAVEANASTRSDELLVLAWRLYDSSDSDAMRVFSLARAAGANVGNPVYSRRHELIRALFRLGRFDDALAEQRRQLDEASDAKKADYRASLERLEVEIAEWRDENGQLRVSEWTSKLAQLDRQIAELEADPDVRMWLAGKR